jgi:hypothetical protein
MPAAAQVTRPACTRLKPQDDLKASGMGRQFVINPDIFAVSDVVMVDEM